jgi:hypothetical protein
MTEPASPASASAASVRWQVRRQVLARVTRLNGTTVNGVDRDEFILASAGELLDSKALQPRTAVRMLLRWNGRHCRPPLDRDSVLRTFERVAGDRSAA